MVDDGFEADLSATGRGASPLHREYHPADMHHLHAHAFEAHGPQAGQAHGHDHGQDQHHHDDHRSLYVLTSVLGLLIGGDIAFGALGWEQWRAPWGVSLALVAAVLGG